MRWDAVNNLYKQTHAHAAYTLACIFSAVCLFAGAGRGAASGQGGSGSGAGRRLL